MPVSVIMKNQSIFIRSLLVSKKRLETKVQKVKHILTLAVRMAVSVIMKKQSNFISRLLVPQKRVETKV